MVHVIYFLNSNDMNPYQSSFECFSSLCIETNDIFTFDINKSPIQELLNYLYELYINYNELILISHNGRNNQDIILKKGFRELSPECENKYIHTINNINFIDTMLLSQYFITDLTMYTLNSVCESFNITSRNDSSYDMNHLLQVKELWNKLKELVIKRYHFCSAEYINYLLCL